VKKAEGGKIGRCEGNEFGRRNAEGGNYCDKASESNANNCLDDFNVHNDPNPDKPELKIED
jgi:hypothetical protein